MGWRLIVGLCMNGGQIEGSLGAGGGLYDGDYGMVVFGVKRLAVGFGVFD